MKNVYYDTAGCGLEQIGVLDEDGLSYEYNTMLVVRDPKTGRVFYATDSGSSCPTPFEEYHFNDADDTDLSEIKPGDSFASFEREVQAFPAGQAERDELLLMVREKLKK